MEQIINGSMAADEDVLKLNTVYIWAGAHAETHVEARMAEDPTLKIEKAADLLDCLNTCLTHSTFFREAREDFYNVKQKPGENTTTFYSRIMGLYRLADFPENSDFLIVDRLIHCCTNVNCKRKLMTKGKDATAKTCLDLLRQHEAVDITMKHLGEACKVNATYTRDPTKQSQKNGSRTKQKPNPKPSTSSTGTITAVKRPQAAAKRCQWCSSDQHSHEHCPVKEARCTFCQKKGHYEKACRLGKKAKYKVKSQNAIDASQSDSSDGELEPSYDIGVLSVAAIEVREVLTDVKFHTHKSSTIGGKIDTGTMVTIMPLCMLNEIGLSKNDLGPSKARLRGVTGTDMMNHGELTVRVSCNDKTDKIKILVTELGNELILGLNFCKLFNLVAISDTCIQRKITLQQQVEAVHITEESEVNYGTLRQTWKQHLPLSKKCGDPLNNLKAIFPETFDGSVGLFEGEVDLKQSPEAKPVQLPPQAVALSMLPKLKSELDKMKREGIIRPCPEVTGWVHNPVIISNKNGDILICLDPKNLNKYLIHSVHYTASWRMPNPASKMANTSRPSMLKAATGQGNSARRVSYSQHSTLLSRNTAS